MEEFFMPAKTDEIKYETYEGVCELENTILPTPGVYRMAVMVQGQKVAEVDLPAVLKPS